MSTHNLCFEQKYEKYQSFLPENFQFLEVKFSLYLNRRIFVVCLLLRIVHHSADSETDHARTDAPTEKLFVKQVCIPLSAQQTKTFTFVNSVDRNEPSHLGLHSLPFCIRLLMGPLLQKWTCPNLKTEESTSKTQG